MQDLETRLYMLRAKLLAARAKARQDINDQKTVALVGYSLMILQVVQYTFKEQGAIFRTDWDFVRGTEKWLREYFHDVDSE